MSAATDVAVFGLLFFLLRKSQESPLIFPSLFNEVIPLEKGGL